jgi:hypothetical protein
MTVAAARFGSCTLAACAGSRVFAAEAPPADSENAELTVVIVTGSRIPIGAVGGTTPLTVLDIDDIRRGALDSLGRVLQTLPFNTGSWPALAQTRPRALPTLPEPIIPTLRRSRRRRSSR